MADELIFNGINAVTGEPLLPPVDIETLSGIIAGQPTDAEHLAELRHKYEQSTQAHYALMEGLDPKDLSQAGWGVLFPYNADPRIIEALRPLLDWRKSQAGRYYREYTGPEGYRYKADGSQYESKNEWLTRHGAGPGPADPEKVPYYLLIVGDPEIIPYRFQYQLDVQYAVGRIHFDKPEDYWNYANSVVLAEKKKVALPKKAAFFAVANPDDVATNLSHDQLVLPLAESLSGQKGWKFEKIAKEKATKAALANLLGGKETPALLFSASHGMGFPKGHELQFSDQGGLLCQDWPGPKQWRKPIPKDFYLAADDIPDTANVFGLIAFAFACYGAGTPRLDEFAKQAFKARAEIAPKSFLAALPKRLLAHPKGGALAYIGHVERAWGYSFSWGKAGKQLAVFISALNRLFEGHPVGSAFEFFNQRYAELSSDLSSLLEEIEFGAAVDKNELAGMWTANNDARDFAILGDPAVRLMV